MRAFAAMILYAFIAYCVSDKDSNVSSFEADSYEYVEEESTRGAIMDHHISSFYDEVKEINFRCDNLIGYKIVCGYLGVEMSFEEKIVKSEHGGTIYGQTDGRTLWMYLPTCHPSFKEVFFHEVGHVLLGHNCNHLREELNDEKREGEADFFAHEIMRLLGEELNEYRLMGQLH